jgi:uncharacterized repeat protein (TIGR01451 family)
LSANTASTTVGSQLIYTVEVALANAGSATGVHLDLQLPQGLTYLSSAADRGSGCALAQTNVLACDLDWLSTPLVAHVTVWTQVHASGSLTAAATASENQQDINPADNRASLTISAADSQPALPPPSTAFSGANATHTLKLSGRAQVGHTLTARLRPAARASYQWQLCANGHCRIIPRATRATIRIQAAWRSKRVRVIATQAPDGTRLSATSALVRR